MANKDKKNIHAESYFFRSINEFSRRYLIPSLQRPYVWEKKQVKNFFEDILEKDEGYFIGSVVIITDKTSGRDEIIDGQQRIATLMIILLIIKNKLEKLPTAEGIKDEIENKFLKCQEEKDNRLEFSDKNTNNYYKSLLEGGGNPEEPKTDPQKKIYKAYSLIEEMMEKQILNREDGEFKEKELINLFEKIKKLLFVGIECEDSSIAYELFESMNATGLNLASIDLIKNFILREFQNDTYEEEAIKEWGDIENIFSDDRKMLKTFFRHHWISCGEYVSHVGLFDEIKKEYRDDRDKLKEYLRDIKNNAQIYYDLRRSNISNLDLRESFDSGVKDNAKRELERVFNVLSYLGVDQVYSPILYFYRTSDDFEKFQKYVNKLFAFQLLFKYIPGNPSKPERIFSDIAGNPKKNKTEGQKINDNFEKLLDLVENQKEDFIKEFVKKSVYKEGKSGDIQYILELYIYNKEYSAKPFSEPTIEHIIDKSNKRKNINKIGNLTIFEKEKNGEMPKILKEKVKVYKGSMHKEHKEIFEVYDFSKKSEEEIERRSKDIADSVFDIFLKILETGKINKYKDK